VNDEPIINESDEEDYPTEVIYISREEDLPLSTIIGLVMSAFDMNELPDGTFKLVVPQNIANSFNEIFRK